MIPYNPIITHDIDRFFKWKNTKSILGETGRIFHNQSSWSYREAWSSFFNRKKSDPFSNLLEIANLDLAAGLPSVFYFMTTEEKHAKNINDYRIDDPEIQEMIKALISNKIEIGLHPGILTYNDETRMQEQKDRLERVAGQKIIRSRQHYLKFEYPRTFRILESIGIKNDSSILVDLSKEKDPEKRTTYPMYDSDQEKTMMITQTPLVFMETHYMHLKDEEILATLESSVKPAKEEGGEIMILWHNNNISNDRERGLYREALQVIKN